MERRTWDGSLEAVPHRTPREVYGAYRGIQRWNDARTRRERLRATADRGALRAAVVVLLIVGIPLAVLGLGVTAVLLTWLLEPDELSRGEVLAIAVVTFLLSVLAGRIRFRAIVSAVLSLAEAASYTVRHVAGFVEIPRVDEVQARRALLSGGFEFVETRPAEQDDAVQVAAWIYRPSRDVTTDDAKDLAEHVLTSAGIRHHVRSMSILPEDSLWFR